MAAEAEEAEEEDLYMSVAERMRRDRKRAAASTAPNKCAAVAPPAAPPKYARWAGLGEYYQGIVGCDATQV